MGLDVLRKADWLNPQRVRAYLWLLALLNLATLVVLVGTSRAGVDRNGFLLGTDFLSFWTAGRMLNDHADVYDQAAHIAAQGAYFRQEGAFTAFFYPPGFLPFCWPLGWLDYFPALAAWLLTTGMVFAAAIAGWLRTFLRDSRPIAPLWLLLAAFPATVIEITHGQTAFLIAGLLALATLILPRAPVAAGLLLGLATIKPQFGPLIPLVLLLTGEWRAIFAAIAGAAALSGLSAALFGASVWPDWLTLTRSAQAAMDAGAVGYAKMVSPFAGAMLLGAPERLAYALQAGVAVLVAALLARVSWRRRYTAELGALKLAGAVLATPFELDYDLLLLAPAMIVLVARGTRGGFADWEKLAVFLAFAAPAFARPLGLSFHVPVVPPITGLLFWVLWRRLRAEPNERDAHA